MIEEHFPVSVVVFGLVVNVKFVVYLLQTYKLFKPLQVIDAHFEEVAFYFSSREKLNSL